MCAIDVKTNGVTAGSLDRRGQECQHGAAPEIRRSACERAAHENSPEDDLLGGLAKGEYAVYP